MSEPGSRVPRAVPPTVTVIGEALIDLVPRGAPGDFRAVPGGSPYNVAVGLARLGHRTSLMARLADNAFGRLLRGHALAEGLDLSRAPRAAEPTTLAIVSLDAEAQAVYDFYHDRTADWQWTAAETARVPEDTAILHFGSLASWTQPGDRHVHAAALASRRRGDVLVSYDPNVRPALLGEPALARPRVERCVAAAHLVKASREDVAWLYPGSAVETVGARWLELGAELVVITDGPRGATLLRADAAPVHRPGRPIELADTVGAGDAFTSGLLGALIRRALHTPQALRAADAARLAAAADDAILVSALTCERVGADPPVAVSAPDTMTDRLLLPTDLKFRG